jgi:hypothetical protein
MIICPECKHQFNETEEVCHKCNGTKFIEIQTKKKISKGLTDKVPTITKSVVCPRCNGGGLELSAKNRNNRKRGASNEYKAINFFKDWWTIDKQTYYEWRKTPQSGGSVLASGFDLAGDICTTAKNFKFSVECKRTQAWDFGQLINRPSVYGAMYDYISQCWDDCPDHRIPLLWLQHPGPSQPAYIMIFEQPDKFKIIRQILDQHDITSGCNFYGCCKLERNHNGYIIQINQYDYIIMGLANFNNTSPNWWSEIFNNLNLNNDPNRT